MEYKLTLLNNTLSPSFLLEFENKKFLVNTPKGFYKNLDKKIDGVILTSSDKYCIYDLEFIQYYQSSAIIPCYILEEYEHEIKKVWSNYLHSLIIKEIKLYKEFEGILPILLYKETEGIVSNKVLGLKINKTLILPSYYSFTKKSILYLNNLDLLLLTVKYLHKENKKDGASVEEIIEILKDKEIKEVKFLGLSERLKHVFWKGRFLRVDEQIII